MAHEFKTGDTVWIKRMIISHQGGDSSGWWVSDGTNSMDWVPTSRMVIDSPSLPAVAALLTDEPQLPWALAEVGDALVYVGQDERLAYAVAIVGRLAAALNGGTDGND